MVWLWITIDVLLFAIIISGLSLWNASLTKKKKRQSQIYAIIIGAKSNAIPMQKLTSSLQLDFTAISKDIESMSINHYDYPLLKGVYIDIGNQYIVLDSRSLYKVEQKQKKHSLSNNECKDISTVICKNCGAENTKENGIAKICEYCGSPLK